SQKNGFVGTFASIIGMTGFKVYKRSSKVIAKTVNEQPTPVKEPTTDTPHVEINVNNGTVNAPKTHGNVSGQNVNFGRQTK
ncbi:MAG: hypothetical protein AAF701_10245, partial [Pseudomonadota bacterium]